MAYADVSKRIDDSIHDSLGGTNCGRFANALRPYRMMRRWSDGAVCLPTRRLHRGRNQVILEVAPLNIAVFVERDFLVHRRCQPLRQATVYLPLNDHRIDDGATVVNSHKAPNMYLACASIDINNTDVGTKWIGQIGRVIVVDCLQSWLQVRRTIGVSGESQFLDSLTLARSALDEETPRLPFEVFFSYFKEIGGNLFRLITHLTGR